METSSAVKGLKKSTISYNAMISSKKLDLFMGEKKEDSADLPAQE
jgi:hypothetical protein